MSPAPIVIPPLRDLALGAVPRLLEAALVPSALFLVLLRFGGLAWAVIGAFVWSISVVGVRLALGRRIPTVVVLGLGALGLRTAFALAAGNGFVYFLQPTLGTAAVGVALLVSAVAGRPLVLRIARDFCPVPEDVMEHGHFRRYFLGLSVIWGLVQLANAAITLWLLLSQSLESFVVLRTTCTYTLTATAIALTVLGLRRAIRVHEAAQPLHGALALTS